MSEEEKKAIEILEEFKKTGFHMLSIKYDKDRVHTNKMIENSIETVLNLIEKQVKVIDAMARDIYIEHEPHFATEETVKEFYFKEVKNND